MIWNLFPFKVNFSFGKSQKLHSIKSGLYMAESPGWFNVSPKNCMRCDTWAGVLSWQSCQSLVSHSWIMQIVSMEVCSSLKQNLMQICCCTQSFWMRWPQGTHAHLMASTHPRHHLIKSSLFTHAHSSPLPLAAQLRRCCSSSSHYANNGWTFSRQTSYFIFAAETWNKWLTFHS